MQGGLLRSRRQARGVVIGDDVTSWLVGLRPVEWTFFSVFGTINNVWKSIIDASWGLKLTYLLALPTADSDFDLVVGSCSFDNFPLVSQYLPRLPMALALLGSTEELTLSVGFTSQVIKHSTVGGVTDWTSTFLFRLHPL